MGSLACHESFQVPELHQVPGRDVLSPDRVDADVLSPVPGVAGVSVAEVVVEWGAAAVAVVAGDGRGPVGAHGAFWRHPQK